MAVNTHFLVCLGCVFSIFTSVVGQASVSSGQETTSGQTANSATRITLLVVVIVELIVVIVLLAIIIKRDRASRRKPVRKRLTIEYIFDETEKGESTSTYSRNILLAADGVDLDDKKREEVAQSRRKEACSQECSGLPLENIKDENRFTDDSVLVLGLSELEEETCDNWEENENASVSETEDTVIVEDEHEYVNDANHLRSIDLQDFDELLEETSDTSVDTEIFVGNINDPNRIGSSSLDEYFNAKSSTGVVTRRLTKQELEPESPNELNTSWCDEVSISLEGSDVESETDTVREQGDSTSLVVDLDEQDANNDLSSDPESLTEYEVSQEIDPDHLPLDIDFETDTDVSSDMCSLNNNSVSSEDDHERFNDSDDLECHRENLYQSYINSIANDLSLYTPVNPNAMTDKTTGYHKIRIPKEKQKSLSTDFML